MLFCVTLVNKTWFSLHRKKFKSFKQSKNSVHLLNNIYFSIKNSTCVLLFVSLVQACSLVNSGVFRIYENKRLTSVTSTTITSSRMECLVKWLETNGCLAVSITTDNDVMSCGLATGATDVLDDDGSNIYVLGKSDHDVCIN